MFILSNFLYAIANVLGVVIDILTFALIARALLSWVNPDPHNQIVQFIERITEPMLVPFRRLVPPFKIGLDVSPILAILFLYFIKLFLVRTLISIALRIQ